MPEQERNYPISIPPEKQEDPRFTFGLFLDVAEVLERHGYPQVTPRDHVELSVCLFRFIYRGES